MRKQSFKLFAMAMLLSVSATFALAGNNYGDRRDAFSIDVPFEFQIGDKEFDAGSYQIFRDDRFKIVIENRDTGHQSFYLGNFNGRYKLGDLKYSLRFNKYGDKHFLRKITARGAAFDLPKTRAEKRQKKAMNMKKPDRVMLGNE